MAFTIDARLLLMFAHEQRIGMPHELTTVSDNFRVVQVHMLIVGRTLMWSFRQK